MWPFEPRYSQYNRAFAPLLDSVFTEVVGRLNRLERVQFVGHLRENSNVEALNEQDPSGNSIFWRDKRIPGFFLSVDYGFPWWGLSVTADGAPVKPSFVGLMLTATGAEQGATQEKCVSVENYIAVKATSAAKALGQLLCSTYGYRYLA